MPGLLRDLIPPRNLTDTTGLKIVNRLRPALLLYPDILEYILLLGASSIADASLRRYTVLSYSQVCHDWRRVALSSKFLWLQLADFDFMPWPWNKEMLRRSHPLPIVVGSYCCLPRDVETVEAELEHIGRIRAYHLGFTRDTWDVLMEKLQRPAEQLNSLSLSHISKCQNPHSPNSSYHDQAATFVLPRTLFSSSAPDLRHLSLQGCLLDVRSSIYTQLTSLHVEDIDARYNTTLTALEWLNLLSQMPRIRILELKNAIYLPESSLRRKREQASPSSGPPPALVLPKLECLHLWGPMREIAELLGGIEVPPGCVISIACQGCRLGDELDHILTASFRGLTQSLNRDESSFSTEHSKPKVNLPMLFYGSGSTLRMQVGQGVLQNFFGVIQDCDFMLCLEATDASWQSILSPLLASLSDDSYLGKFYDPLLSNITSLKLRLPSPHPDLITFLARTINVRALLDLSGYFGAWLLKEMGSLTLRPRGDLGTEVGVDMGDVILPRLEALSFCDDRCLYDHYWSSLEMFLRIRTRAVLTDESLVNERSNLETSPFSLSSGSPRQMRDKRVSRIERVLIRHASWPEDSDKVKFMASIGVLVDYE